jgi:hypothetical protein
MFRSVRRATFWEHATWAAQPVVRSRCGPLALALACLTTATGCGEADHTSQGHRPAGTANFFAAGGIWNRPLPSRAPLAPDSGALVRDLAQQVRAKGAWINTDHYSVPIVTVGRAQRRVAVRLDTRYPPLQRAFASVPVPPSAQPAAGSDQHLVVWQPGTDTMWEFWHMQRRPDAWHARWGAKITHASRSAGVVPAPEGATGSGLPLAGGLMTAAELRRGRIDHALALALPALRAGVVAAPADRTDGRVARATAIPMGTRFRLDPRVNVDALGLPPAARMIARAAQRYGMIVRDTSGSVTLYAQAPPPGQGDVYGPVFRGASPDKLLARFPWDRLQVVRSRVSRVSGG